MSELNLSKQTRFGKGSEANVFQGLLLDEAELVALNQPEASDLASGEVEQLKALTMNFQG